MTKKTAEIGVETGIAKKRDVKIVSESLSQSMCDFGLKMRKVKRNQRQRRGKGLSCKSSYILQKLNRKSARNLQCRLHSLRMFTYLKQALRV